MKRMNTLISGTAIFFVVIMFFHVSDIVHDMYGFHNSLLSIELVLAQPEVTEAVPVKDGKKTASDYDNSLMKNLMDRQKQLDNREKALKEEERKIEALKKEVTEKMDALRALEEKMSPPLDVQKEETDKKYKTLAKMYEATPPEKAAIIFEKMERKMAAEIMLRMNSKKAGAIWAQINRDIGLDIVREITASQSVDAASATKIAKEISGEVSAKPETLQGASAESIARTGKQIAGAEVPKSETSRDVEREIPPIKGKKYVGLKGERSKNARPGVHKPFAIQIKAVWDLEMAREYTKMLEEQGIDAYWSGMNVKGKGTLYRILIGRFASHEDAIKYMKDNHVESNYPGSFIYRSDQISPKKKKKKK